MKYKTNVLCGSNCAIADLDTIARMDRLCDDFGLDTIETGATAWKPARSPGETMRPRLG
jgi:aldehyde:ferredoxin oxidoreductase